MKIQLFIFFLLFSPPGFSQSRSKTPCDSEVFEGTARKAAKTTVSPAKMEVFKNIESLRATLPTDQEMSNKKIPVGKESGRVKEEDRNILIREGWLYTFSREGDEDFHMIVGTTPDSSTAEYFNVEISGLPEAGSRDTMFLNPRKVFTDTFGPRKCSENYKRNKLKKPRKIAFAGSLFYDAGHCRKEPFNPAGPDWARPNTCWEIHPVTWIRFY